MHLRPVDDFCDLDNCMCLTPYTLKGYVSEREATEADAHQKTIRSLSVNNNNSLILINNPVPFTARDIVLRLCYQTEPLPFKECYPETNLVHCHKIGEGVYGEVFLLRNPNGGTSVMKIIPIEDDHLIVNGEHQKKFEEILTEIVIALELSNLRNISENSTSCFNEVKTVRCVQGRYPDRLLELWNLYDDYRQSENDSPEIFGNDQLFVVLELANGGQDLTTFYFDDASQTYALYRQIACALAVAECALQFEHRDLHCGNVLVSKCDKNKNLSYSLNGKKFEVATQGVELTIIDFTFSRITSDGIVTYNDLSLDHDLFLSHGDDYQSEIYCLMQKRNGNNWQHFEPYSNVLWLHFILDKMINNLNYKCINTMIHKQYLMKMQTLKDEILGFNSAKDIVINTFLK